jgi:uncharacterized protein
VPTYFADTSIWIALSSRRDRFHERALAWQRSLTSSQSRIVTTEPVLWEWLNAFAKPPMRWMAAEGYRRMRADKSIVVISASAALSNAAVDLYQDRSDKSWGITDCFSFVVMANLGLEQALTADHHFAQAGYVALLLSEPNDL